MIDVRGEALSANDVRNLKAELVRDMREPGPFRRLVARHYAARLAEVDREIEEVTRASLENPETRTRLYRLRGRQEELRRFVSDGFGLAEFVRDLQCPER